MNYNRWTGRINRAVDGFEWPVWTARQRLQKRNVGTQARAVLQATDTSRDLGNDYKNATWAPKPVPFYKRLIQAVTIGFGAVLAAIAFYILAVVLMAL